MKRDYDAHIYFTPESLATAQAVRAKALQDFANQEIFVSRLVNHEVGPHPRPMFEIIFGQEKLGDMVKWLLQNRNGLAVLLHQVTGHDTKDHSQGAIWMGEMLQLDFSIFDT